MGMVTGEDAVEVANSPTDCVQDCQAQNQVRGRLAVLGFPFQVAAGSKLTPPDLNQRTHRAADALSQAPGPGTAKPGCATRVGVDT
jgi:hypothetical protein